LIERATFFNGENGFGVLQVKAKGTASWSQWSAPWPRPQTGFGGPQPPLILAWFWIGNLSVYAYARLDMALDEIKLVSGGQTGADITALDFAIERGIPHGGWCPRGREAEDGTIDQRYQIQGTPSGGCVRRREWNVRDSDGTVLFSIAPVLTGWSKKTVELVHKHRKPVLHLAWDGGPAAPEQALRRFILDHGIKVLNVAGPRASKEPEVGPFVKQVLGKALDLAESLVPDEPSQTPTPERR
jgi:hypothetical protein